MICGLIPSFGSYNTFRWVLIVFITLLSLLTFFLISNRIVNNILDNTTDSSILVNDINSKNRENAPYRKSLDDLVKDYKKRDNIDHVDIEK
jgi:capsular polysaccharide biosynthesis protein